MTAMRAKRESTEDTQAIVSGTSEASGTKPFQKRTTRQLHGKTPGAGVKQEARLLGLNSAADSGTWKQKWALYETNSMRVGGSGCRILASEGGDQNGTMHPRPDRNSDKVLCCAKIRRILTKYYAVQRSGIAGLANATRVGPMLHYSYDRVRLRTHGQPGRGVKLYA